MQGLGACLTMSNLDDIKRFIEDFAVRALLPAMEARVRALNHQVSHPSPLTVISMACTRLCQMEFDPEHAHHLTDENIWAGPIHVEGKCRCWLAGQFDQNRPDRSLKTLHWHPIRVNNCHIGGIKNKSRSASAWHAGQVDQEGPHQPAEDPALAQALHRVCSLHAWPGFTPVRVSPRGRRARQRCQWRPDRLLWRLHRVPDAVPG